LNTATIAILCKTSIVFSEIHQTTASGDSKGTYRSASLASELSDLKRWAGPYRWFAVASIVVALWPFAAWVARWLATSRASLVISFRHWWLVCSKPVND